jgi:hypothetical protein
LNKQEQKTKKPGSDIIVKIEKAKIISVLRVNGAALDSSAPWLPQQHQQSDSSREPPHLGRAVELLQYQLSAGEIAAYVIGVYNLIPGCDNSFPGYAELFAERSEATLLANCEISKIDSHWLPRRES